MRHDIGTERIWELLEHVFVGDDFDDEIFGVFHSCAAAGCEVLPQWRIDQIFKLVTRRSARAPVRRA